ncbi:MAG: hypothetical protein KIT83_14780 [Bryobacterales bacterium]|nr:hypothetical protein [Bryobacterales bacterium]
MTFPPTPHPHPLPPAPPPSRLPKYLLIGCGTLLALALIGGIAAYLLFWTAVDQIAHKFTTERPLSMPQVQLSDAEMEALERRVGNFGSAGEGYAADDVLVLSADEINALIQRHSKFKVEGSGVVVRIVGNQLEGEISIPAGQLSPSLEGRFVNGKAVFSVGVVDGRVVAYIQDLRVGDSYIPDAIRESLSRENLLRDAYDKDSDISEALSRISSVEVRNGTVVLTPAQARQNTP